MNICNSARKYDRSTSNLGPTFSATLLVAQICMKDNSRPFFFPSRENSFLWPPPTFSIARIPLSLQALSLCPVKPLSGLLIFSQWVMALFIARSALHWLQLSKGGLGWLGPFKSLRHQSSIWLLFHPAGFHHTGMPAMRSRGTSRTLLLFVGRYKACRHHEQMLAPAVRLQWPSARFSRGSSCLLKMLVDNEALGQSDCRWTLEWLNKSRRWVSLLWVSPVSHLFIAPLSLISSHCLCDWHKSICCVVPTWCLVHLPLCLCAVKPRHLSSTCGTWAKMPFEVPKTYGQCLDIQRQMCSRNSSSRQPACAGARVIPGPSGRLLPRFQPPSSSRAGTAGRIVCGLARNNSCSLCNRWPGGKF